MRWLLDSCVMRQSTVRDGQIWLVSQAEGWWCDKSVTFLRYQPSKGKERKVSRLVRKGEILDVAGVKITFYCEFCKTSVVLWVVFSTGYLQLLLVTGRMRTSCGTSEQLECWGGWGGETGCSNTTRDFHISLSDICWISDPFLKTIQQTQDIRVVRLVRCRW